MLRIEALGSLSGNGDVTAFVDQVEIVRVSDGVVMAGAVANPSFETNGLGAGQFSYNTAGAFWTFISNSGIARTGSGFGPTTPPQGNAVAFVQSGGGNNGRLDQILTLADGVYRVQFRTTQRTNCCGGTLDQRLSVLVNGASVGMIQPPASASYATFTSNTFVVGTPNNALDFDGANDIVRSTTNMPAASEFTLEGWVNPTAFGGLRSFVLADAFPAGAMHCQFGGNNLAFTIGGNNPQDVNSTSALPTGRWSHVACVYSSTAKTLRIYVNGVLNTSVN